MPLTKEQISQIENTIKDSLRKKFQTYSPETSNMPFHYRLFYFSNRNNIVHNLPNSKPAKCRSYLCCFCRYCDGACNN